MNVKDVIAVVPDNGQFHSFAERLARDYERVMYVISQDKEMPTHGDAMTGEGMDGIEVISSRDEEQTDDAQLWVFPDLGFGHTQVKKEKECKLVWGSRMGEEMEIWVEDFKDLLKDVGLPVGPWERVTGFKALREYLQKNKGEFYVKVSKYRGDWETLHCTNYEDVKSKLDLREFKLSGISDTIEFVVCEALKDKIELAIDGWCIDGQWPKQVLVGMEQKGDCYLGRFMDYKDIPRPLLEVNKRLEETIRNYGYRGSLAFETLIGKDGKPYVSDPCTRCSSPCNELQQEFYTNLPEIVLRGAQGQMIEAVPPKGAIWGAEVMIQSEWVNHNWQPLRFPEKYRRNIKLGEACRKKNGQYQVIPQGIGLTQCGGIVAWSDDPEDAIKQLEQIAEEVKGPEITIPIKAFDDLRAKLEEAQSYGLDILE